MTAAGLYVADLHVHFSRGRRLAPIRAVDGVDLVVPAGQTVGLIGESGSGKTTVGRAILGLNRPTQGSIELVGDRGRTDLLRERDRQAVQTIFQDPHSSLDPRMTIWESLVEPLKIQRRLDASSERRLLELARIFRSGVWWSHENALRPGMIGVAEHQPNPEGGGRFHVST